MRENAPTTKVRIVYNTSAKERKSNISINDCLHMGPSLIPLLFDILLRFQQQKVTFVADMEKAFFNIEVHEQDSNNVRFLWVDRVLQNNLNLVAYRFCRVVFGMNLLPFLLNATLRYLISRYLEHNKDFADKLLRSFYDNDLATCKSGTESVYLLFTRAKQ